MQTGSPKPAPAGAQPPHRAGSLREAGPLASRARLSSRDLEARALRPPPESLARRPSSRLGPGEVRSEAAALKEGGAARQDAAKVETRGTALLISDI